MPARFTEELKNALEKFDVGDAELLTEKIQEAEAAGYEMTTAEDRLWTRLTTCIQQYYNALRAIER
jgi:head-tail adaptor